MFTLFHDPFYYRYRPTYWFQPPTYSRRQSLFEKYLDALDQRFFSILSDDDAELLKLEEQSKRENASIPASSPASPNDDASTPSTPTSPPSQPSTQSAQSTQSTQSTQSSDSQSSDKGKIDRKKETRPYYGRQYISHTKSTFNGQNYVEEHREKVTGCDGETRIATRRRLGDRWYENEIHIDKDGKKTERETWHNVADEDIEKFKLEWTEKGGVKGTK